MPPGRDGDIDTASHVADCAIELVLAHGLERLNFVLSRQLPLLLSVHVGCLVALLAPFGTLRPQQVGRLLRKVASVE